MWTGVAVTPEAERVTGLHITEVQEFVIKTLAISWCSLEDTLTISTTNIPKEVPLTKRNALRGIATEFDPLGSVGPFVIKAKILLQELWSQGYDWDVSYKIRLRASS